MLRRILLMLGVVAVLVALIVYSQMRPTPNYVSGVIETEEIRLGSRVGGRVKAVHVREGDTVDTGAPLIEFEIWDLEERENQAKAELAEREAAYQKAMAGMRPEEIAQAKAKFEEAQAELNLKIEGSRPDEIAAAQDRLTAANSELEQAQLEFERVSRLFQTRAASKSEFEQTQEQLKVAEAIANVRKNELKNLQAGSREQEIGIARAKAEFARLSWELAKQGNRAEEKEQARAARDAAAAALQVIRAQKVELVVTAPAEGVIDALDLQPGDLVAAGAPVITMLSLNDMWVRAYVPQRFLRLKVGQQLRVTVDAFPGEDFVGELTYISQQAEFTPSNVQTPDDRAKQVYRIRVTLRDNQKVRAGMTANVWLEPAGGANE